MKIKIIKKYLLAEIIFISLVLSVFIFWFPADSFFKQVTGAFSAQIAFSLLTAFFVTSIIQAYNVITKFRYIKKYLGHWIVLEPGNNDYQIQMKVVEIRRTLPLLTLSYSLTDLSNTNRITGKIYINQNNRDTGKLISSIEWLENTAQIYPVKENSIFFDENIYNNKLPLIRIINLSGEEEMILGRPEDQENLRKTTNDLLLETETKMANKDTSKLMNILKKTSR